MRENGDDARFFMLNYTPRTRKNSNIGSLFNFRDVQDGKLRTEDGDVDFLIHGKVETITFYGKLPFIE
jgi:hypothetical protein